MTNIFVTEFAELGKTKMFFIPSLTRSPSLKIPSEIHSTYNFFSSQALCTYLS